MWCLLTDDHIEAEQSVTFPWHLTSLPHSFRHRRIPEEEVTLQSILKERANFSWICIFGGCSLKSKEAVMLLLHLDVPPLASRDRGSHPHVHHIQHELSMPLSTASLTNASKKGKSNGKLGLNQRNPNKCIICPENHLWFLTSLYFSKKTSFSPCLSDFNCYFLLILSQLLLHGHKAWQFVILSLP